MDFSFYDHVLDTIVMLGAIPERYRALQDQLNEPLDIFFAMARGRQKGSVDVRAMEMTKMVWHQLPQYCSRNND